MSKKNIQRTAIKISFLGDAACGKTSIINRYLENRFSDIHLTTIGLEKNEKKDENERWNSNESNFMGHSWPGAI